MAKSIRITESQLKRLMAVINEQVDMEEAPSDFQFFKSHDSLQELRDAIAKNQMVSVAYVKDDGSIRHMLFRRYLNKNTFSDAPKSDAQKNLNQNNDIKKVIDLIAYRKELKRLKDENEFGQTDFNSLTKAANSAFRSIKLKNVLGFLAGGKFFDLREENDIRARFGEEIYNSLTKGMVKNLEAQQAQEERNEQNPGEEPPADEMSNDLMEEIKRMKKIILI